MGQEDVPLAERKQYFISDQTWEGLQICIKSFVEVVKFSLDIPGVNFVVATKFNQDVLEKFLGKLRKKRGAYGAFTCKEFIHSYSSSVFSQSHAIKTVRRIKRSGCALEDLDVDLPLPKRRKNSGESYRYNNVCILALQNPSKRDLQVVPFSEFVL